MTKSDDRYWIGTDSLMHSPLTNKSDTFYEIKGTSFQYIQAPHTQDPHNPKLSHFELFPYTQTFCCKPEPLYSTHYSDHFVAYQAGFNMHTGQLKTQFMMNEYNSGEIVLDTTTKQCFSSTKSIKQLCYH